MIIILKASFVNDKIIMLVTGIHLYFADGKKSAFIYRRDYESKF